jgi:hypothetical protein
MGSTSPQRCERNIVSKWLECQLIAVAPTISLHTPTPSQTLPAGLPYAKFVDDRA